MIKTFNKLFVTMFGLGKIPKVPGTFGSLTTIIILYILFHVLNLSTNLILLSLIICSSVAGECMPPFDWHEMFDTKYDCLHFGYNEAINKLEEIGKKDINQYGMYIKFACTPISTI